ncbi:hypothetical protein SKAU_G00016230, partial [Synaphobranchus kaupii]
MSEDTQNLMAVLERERPSLQTITSAIPVTSVGKSTSTTVASRSIAIFTPSMVFTSPLPPPPPPPPPPNHTHPPD